MACVNQPEPLGLRCDGRCGWRCHNGLGGHSVLPQPTIAGCGVAAAQACGPGVTRVRYNGLLVHDDGNCGDRNEACCIGIGCRDPLTCQDGPIGEAPDPVDGVFEWDGWRWCQP
jgi:hypothetical protein